MDLILEGLALHCRKLALLSSLPEHSVDLVAQTAYASLSLLALLRDDLLQLSLWRAIEGTYVRASVDEAQRQMQDVKIERQRNAGETSALERVDSSSHRDASSMSASNRSYSRHFV